MTRTKMTWLAVALLLCLPSAAVLAAPGDEADSVKSSETRHVRCLTSGSLTLFKTAFGRSPTVRALVRRLEASDLIVYVTLGQLPSDLGGATRLLSVVRGTRFVTITVNSATAPFARASNLGHELRHAVEIADAPDVTDEAGMQRLFARIGWRSGSQDRWETAEALDAGQRVWNEVWDSPRHLTDLADNRGSLRPRSQ